MRPEAAHFRVLVVDDEKIIADTVALIVRSRGFDARVAYDAEEALNVATGFPPDALISDVMMPGMNGVELSRHIMARHPDCRVLLISGNPAAAAALFDVTPDGKGLAVLAKPVHPSEILSFLAAPITVE